MDYLRHFGFKPLILGFTLALIPAAFAGPGKEKGKEKDRPFPSPDMVKELKLTEPQVKSLKELHQKHLSETADLRKKVHDAWDALQEGMKQDLPEKDLQARFEAAQAAKQEMGKIRFAQILAVRKILTPEQRKNFRGMMEKRKGHSKHWGEHPHEGDGPEEE